MDQSAHQQLLEAIRGYQVPAPAVELLEQHPPLIIAGVSSVGKNTIAEKIAELTGYRRVITHTTRQPRDGEANGKNYWFVNESEIARLVSINALIEVQLVHGETIYGTSISAYKAIIDSGGQPLLLVDIYGALKFINHSPNSSAFFLLPPSFEEWMARFQKRGQISHTEQAKRLQTGKSEMDLALKTSRITLIINRDVPLAAKEIAQGWAAPETQAQARTIAQHLIENIQAY